jgi:putative nucleotidyltransferase with HDIG domain
LAEAVSGAPTVLLDVLAESLIDRTAQAVCDGDTAPLVEWVATTARSRADIPAVRNLFLALGGALTRVFGEAGFTQLTAVLAPALPVLQAEASTPDTEAIDELDLVLADMVSRIESNDPMTAEHCRAVSAWCGRIAQRMALPRAEAMFVARGGLIHDVGKSETPAEILLAPRALTDAEWNVMRKHVIAGHDIVSGNAQLRDFSPIVRSHHERVDGRGYPDGLERASIPIAVRIVTVADAFNAMIGRRTYRTPHSPDFAVAELRRNAGAQFDPNVVIALIDVVSGGHDRTFSDGAVA